MSGAHYRSPKETHGRNVISSNVAVGVGAPGSTCQPAARALPAATSRHSDEPSPPRWSAVGLSDRMKRAAGKKPCRSAAPDQAPLWSDAETPPAYDLINRRRSMIRRLDHLLEDATNEQFHEAAVVLRDALERLRLALVKDTLGP